MEYSVLNMRVIIIHLTNVFGMSHYLDEDELFGVDFEDPDELNRVFGVEDDATGLVGDSSNG